MGYKSELQSNNTDLQTILDTINAMEGGSEVESTFIPTDSGVTGYKGDLADNNADLTRILELVESLPDAPWFAALKTDFEYTNNGDGTYTITDWKGVLNGVESTELVIPDSSKIIL